MNLIQALKKQFTRESFQFSLFGCLSTGRGIDPLQSPHQNNGTPQGIAIAANTLFSGPIPSPQFLKEYDFIVPGSAKRFLDEPHLEAEHRRSMEKLMVQGQINLSKKGQWMAFFLATLIVIGAFTTICLGYELSGFGSLFTSVALFIGVFIYKLKVTDQIKSKN